MPTVTVRNLPEGVHRAIRLRAARHGRSAEAEIRLILARCVADEEPLKIGSELRAFAERFGGVDLPITRDGSPIEPADFG
jgi:plasmid stability protein